APPPRRVVPRGTPPAPLRGRHPIFLHQHLPPVRRPVARCRGIQLKRTMDDLHLGTTVEARERVLETALADVAPRTHEVGPDIDTHMTSIAGPDAVRGSGVTTQGRDAPA